MPRVNLSGASHGTSTSEGTLVVEVAEIIQALGTLERGPRERFAAIVEGWYLQPPGDVMAFQREVERETGPALGAKVLKVARDPAIGNLLTLLALLLALVTHIARQPDPAPIQPSDCDEFAERVLRDAREMEREQREEALEHRVEALERQRERAKRFAEERERSKPKQPRPKHSQE